jgi:hypothetical protein
VGAALAGGHVGVVTGALAIDLGLGRRTRALGPRSVEIGAPREKVFDVIAAGYLARQPKAVAGKIRVLERGSDMVLAAHRTPVHGRLVATTVETVRLNRPERLDFRLVRGPVPHVAGRFTLTATNTGTTRDCGGELGTDLWRIGQLWADLVADRWEQAVAAWLEAIKAEAARRGSVGAPTGRTWRSISRVNYRPEMRRVLGLVAQVREIWRLESKMTEQVDVVVLGLGVGGEEVAGRLAEAGLDVVGIERRLVGGECPYWGCVPSKMMVRAANLLAEARRIDGMAGHSEITPDWAPVADRIREEATDDWNDQVAVDRFTGKGGRFVRGSGRLVGPGTVEVDGETYEAQQGVCARDRDEAGDPADRWACRHPVLEAEAVTRSCRRPATVWRLGGAGRKPTQTLAGT